MSPGWLGTAVIQISSLFLFARMLALNPGTIIIVRVILSVSWGESVCFIFAHPHRDESVIKKIIIIN